MRTSVFRHASAAGVAILLACSGGALAAPTQGSFGATSTGVVNISASVPSRVQITGLQDVAFTGQDPASAASNFQSICVFSNTSTKGYNIKATGNGASSAFTIGGTGLTAVPYSVEWAQTAAQTTGTSLTTNTALTGQTSTATTPACSAGPTTTATLIVRMGTTALQAMQSNTTYSGTLTLLVGPE